MDLLDRLSYDLDDAAAATGASRRELQRSIEVGDLVAHYIGEKATKPLITRDELVRWLESRPTERGGRRKTA